MAERHGDVGKWLRLSAHYADDPRIRRAGPASEVLYLRALAYMRAHDSDGHLYRENLRDITHGFASRTAQAGFDRLLREDLLRECIDGWTVPDQRWSKWQDTEEEYRAKKEAERQRKAEYRARKRQEREEP